MAAGDVYNIGVTSVSAGSFLDLQPGAGVEIVIHNYSYADAMELYFYDGTNSVLVDADATAGSRRGEYLHCTNTKYYRIKNVAAGAANMAADGMTTK